MIAAERLHKEAGSQKSKSPQVLSQPLLQSGICSSIVTPVPPSVRASRHESLSRRRRKNDSSLLVSRELSRKTSSSAQLQKASTPPHRHLGLEIRPEKLIWRGWEPGEEYTKNFTLKNLNVQTKKIRYKAPSSMFFDTLFPQVIVLSAGTSFTLPITFKPLQRQNYEDKMEFSTSQGTFTLQLQGLLPETNLHIPKSIHFGLSAVHEAAQLSFEIRNLSGDLETEYAWDVPEPFKMQPQKGTLEPRSSAWIQASFRPTAATVYDAQVVCSYGDNLRKTMRVEGVGKYPHLLLSDSAKLSEDDKEITTVSFDSVGIQKSAQKYIYLHNKSTVKAPFKLKRKDGQPWMDQVFSYHIENRIIPPMGSVKIPITYSPHIPERMDVDYFEVSTLGDISKSVFQCVGRSKGPKVILSTNLLHFGLVQSPEESARRSFQIHNQSNCDAIYQFDVQERTGVFQINECSGILPAGQSQTVIITFNPTVCVNYRRKMVMMIHEMGPLYIDLIGTYHSDTEKPPPLKPDHLDRYNIHASRGLCFYPPDVWKKQLEDGKLALDEAGCYMFAGEEDTTVEPSADSAMVDYFDDGHNTELTSNPPHVSLSEMSLWFGEIEWSNEKRTVHQVTVQLSNHTYGKVTAHWVEDASGIYTVTPPCCDILPMKSAEFRVAFLPKLPNKLFGKQLECYVSYKTMRDFQLVDENDVIPPWLLTLDVCGHTFNGRNVTHLPEVAFERKKVVFSPALPNHSTYRTMAIRNDGTTPYLYQFLKISLYPHHHLPAEVVEHAFSAGIQQVKPTSRLVSADCCNRPLSEDNFTIKPSFGYERSKFSVSAVRFTPTAVKTYETDLVVRLNDNRAYDQTVKLVGTGEEPELLLSNAGEMFFRPTCVRTSVVREYEVRNVGRSALRYQWLIPKKDAPNLSVGKEEGRILPNQTQTQTWTFTPTEFSKYVLKAVCLVWPDDGSKDRKEFSPKDAKRYKLRIIGEGKKGEIRAEKYKVDFGSVVAGSSTSQHLVFYNDSLCDVHIRFSMKQSIDSQYGEEPNSEEPVCLKLASDQATIPARSKVALTASMCPYRRVVYTWMLYYQLLSDTGEIIHPTERTLVSELSAEGVYPMMEVIDARPSGSGSSISKTQLWRWFSIDNLNSALDSDPSKAELRYTLKTRNSAQRRPSTYTRSIMDFNFGAAGVGAEPCYVSMMVKNTGSVATKWSFLFPKDLELEVDYWAENGLFDADELHKLHIQDNKLFTIYPSKGVLNPGEHRTLLFTYKHDIPGTHRVPVLLKIEKGKEILLNFVGVTVEPNRRYLHFPGTKHVFTPVPIGEMTPPKQLYEMFNGGAMSVLYEVDMTPLRILESENFHHPILTCLNPKGEIAPGMSSNLEWIFSPLESKTYSVDIPIHIVGGETALITFKGIGYDGRAMGDTMPKLDQPQEFTSVPGTQKVAVPGQILFLSEERISFGNMPLFGKARHMIFLTNQSENRPVSFSWHATSSIVNEVLQIEPIQGQLKPGQSTMVKIVFCAAGQPSFYDLDLVCEVVDLVQMAEYHAELEAWREERDRQAVEFTIMGDEEPETSPLRESAFEIYSGPSKYELSSPKRNIENILNQSQTSLRLTENEPVRSSNKSEFKSFQTLPPIRFENPVKHPSNRSRLIRQQEATAKNEWIRPQIPEPFISHLCVTARTHDIAQYRIHFAKDSEKQFIDRTMQLDLPVPPKSASEPQFQLTTCNEAEKTMVVLIMSDVLRGLLDDPTFHGAVEELGKEETPHFQQLPKDEEEEESLVLQRAEEEVIKVNEDQLILEVVPDKEEPQRSSSLQLMSDMLGPSDTNIWNYPSAFEEATENKDVTGQIKRSPVFGSILEDVLSSTISNIMEEAMKGEVLLNVRPRVVALPPSSHSSVAGSRTQLSEMSPTTRAETEDPEAKKSISSPEP